MSQFPFQFAILKIEGITQSAAKSRALRVLGPKLPQPFVFNESGDPAKLNNQQRGHLAELAFMRKAASLGLSVAKPWNEGERYDFIARVDNVCWRVQVKSASKKSVSRHHYRVKTSGGGRSGQTPYSTIEIDFLVAYIHPENLWYVFPASRIEGKKRICLSPGSKRSIYEKYREAWKLMDPTTSAETSATTAETNATTNDSTNADAGAIAKNKAAGT